MYILLTLFFISLFAVALMIGRKLTFVRNGQAVENEHAHPFVPDFQKIKHLTRKNIKAYGYAVLVGIIRLYVKFVNFLKNKYKEWEIKIIEMSKKRNDHNGVAPEGQETNKFLKMIIDYKRKIREIKHKIHEEEKKQ